MASTTPTTTSSAIAITDPDATAAESREERARAAAQADPAAVAALQSTETRVRAGEQAAAAAALQSTETRARTAEQAAAARLAKEERARAAQAAHDAAAAARAADAEREAAVAQQERDVADALQAALDRVAQEHAVAAPPLEDNAAPGDAEDAEDFASADSGDPHLRVVLLQHEAAALLNLHAQAVAVQNIRLLVPLVLDVASAFYGRWRPSFLLVVGRYSLESHVLSDAAAPNSSDWARMDRVVQTWITGTITDALAEAVIEFGTIAHASWLAIESKFRGNRETHALHLDVAFRNFKQGDLDITAYCWKVKGMADALRDLGELVNDMTLVLNLLRGLNGRFEAIGLYLRRGRPFPTFMQARNDLLLEELTMAESAPPPSATA
ncbi:uncharacterized protein [Miscanthus floridulus]|uniref:uncharacterized protein n=1 Tax=Miscanthus floridulus TaxID=154761 RepID=UPI003457F328